MKKLLVLLAATSALTACHQEHEKETLTKPLTEEQVQLIIDNYVEENPGKIMASINNHIAKIQAEAKQRQFEQQLKNPVKFEIDEGTPTKGADNAVITIVEFSDFECPFCTRVNPTLDAIMKRYEGKIKLAYKHLALPFHQNAEPAALASIAAHNQGKFWEYHDEIFKNQGSLNQETFIAIAKKLDLNIDKFKADMESKEAKDKVAKDLADAQKLGINGTPGLLVNGVLVEGAVPEEHFVTIIEKLLDNMNK